MSVRRRIAAAIVIVLVCAAVALCCTGVARYLDRATTTEESAR
jgi:hypothetical protein